MKKSLFFSCMLAYIVLIILPWIYLGTIFLAEQKWYTKAVVVTTCIIGISWTILGLACMDLFVKWAKQLCGK